jgi:hypothetical protein
LADAYLTGNSAVNITWIATDNVGVNAIDLDYSLDNALSWKSIATGLANNGSYTWAVPNVVTSALLLRAIARDAVGFATYTQSASPITIAQQNTPPITPHSPFPLAGIDNVPPGTGTLQWRSGDVDGDTVTYEVYFGTTANPPLAANGLTATEFTVPLLPQYTYYWRVVAKDNRGSASTSPMYSLITADAIQDKTDSDGDGIPDIAEYLAGTDPNNSAGFLQAILSRLEGGGETVDFVSVPGKRYRLERNDDFPTGEWNIIEDNIVGNGEVIRVPDAEAANLSKAIYRVILLP